MSRSNVRTGSARRKTAGGRTLNRLLQNETGRPRGRKLVKPAYRAEPDDDMDDLAVLSDEIEVILDRHEARNLQNTEVRRRIEMLREEQWLQRELSDIYDS